MLNAKQFTFHLARYAKVSEADAESFMQAVTKVLLEQINAGEDVSIQGLGTFSVVETQQGRRLAFQVDDKMRSQVNAPFACFEPMALAVKSEKKTDVDEETESPATLDVSAAPETPEEPGTVDAVDDQEIVEKPEESDGKEAAVAAAVLLQSLAAAKDKEEQEPAKDPAAAEEPAPVEVPAEESALAEEPAAAEPEPAPASQSKPAPTPRRRVVEPEWYEVWGQKMQAWAEKQAWLKQVEEKTHLKPWMVGAIAGGLIVVLLIILLAVSCGGSEEPKAAPAAQAAGADSTAVAADSTAAVEPSAESQPSASAKTQKPSAVTKAKSTAAKQAAKPKSKSSSGNYVNSSPFTSAERPNAEILLQEGGSPKQVKLEEGERLTLLALSTYGDKAFWAYIYDVNAFQLGDPNSVPTNIPLYLPEPTYFHIDASNPASIKRAQNRAMQILNDPQSDGPWGRR